MPLLFYLCTMTNIIQGNNHTLWMLTLYFSAFRCVKWLQSPFYITKFPAAQQEVEWMTMMIEFISSVGLERTFLHTVPLLRISHFAVTLQNRRPWKTNKNPFSNFILFEQISWSPAGRFEPQLSIAKPCSLVAIVLRTRRCGKARAAILQGQHSKQTSLTALCSGCVRPSHVSWHSRRNSSLLSLHPSASSQAKALGSLQRRNLRHLHAL